MFDLSSEISLPPADKKLYQKLQILLYLAALFLGLYLSYLIIFPHKYFTFSFLTPTSTRNNTSPPVLASGDNLQNSLLPGGNALSFDTTVVGDYSKAVITLNLSGASEKPSNASVSLRKSHQAFMYQLGEPIGWRTGALLRNNGAYYIVSDSNLRKFSARIIPFSLGYTEKSFQEVSPEELIYNPIGEDILNGDTYPNGALFRIEDNYYIMDGQKLRKFVSDQAYLSKYGPETALAKEANFLSRYPVTDEAAGFSDGTLVANGESVFIISNEKILPVDNAQTFESKGYGWDNILTAGTDEIAPYQKDKLFNIKSPHPDGTVFKTSEEATYYMVKNGKKHVLPSAAIAASWFKKAPINVSEKSLGIYARCDFKNNFWNNVSYSCEMPLNQFATLEGFSYEYAFSSGTDIRLDSLSVDYKKDITKKNLKTFLIGLYNSIKGNYAPNPTS